MKNKVNLVYSLTILLFVVGCASEKETPVFPVSGKVTYKGAPPAGALIVLHPQNKAAGAAQDTAASAKVKPDGTFQIGVYKAGDGAPAGEYIATIQWNKEVTTESGTGMGPNVLPIKYASPKTSPIKVTVSAVPANEVPPIDITE